MKPTFREYLVSYTYGGAEWGMTVVAESEREARLRLARAASHGRIVGTLVAKVPAEVPAAGILVRAACWLQSLLKRGR